MAKKRIDGEAEVLTLPRHNVNGVVQEKRADFARRFSHKNARMRLLSHQDGKCPDVILMSMANKNCVDCSTFNWLPIWECVLAYFFRMHPTIQDQSLAAGFEVVRVRADFGVAGEVDELHAGRTRLRNIFFELLVTLQLSRRRWGSSNFGRFRSMFWPWPGESEDSEQPCRTQRDQSGNPNRVA